MEIVDQSKPCTQIYMHYIASCINLQLPIVILKKNKIWTCIIIKRTCISIFSKIRSKHKFICKKNRNLHKFAVTNNNFFKSTLSDMHHRKTYMHINFQQNRVSRSVKNRAHKFIWQNIAICNYL